MILIGCAPKEKDKLVVFAAGSLMIPFDDIEQAFEAANPDIDVLMEYHGSIQCVRHAAELDEPIDIVAVADYSLIPLLMYETIDEDTGLPYADWTIRFTDNALVLAYTDQSAYADEITTENWFEILQKEDVRFGLSDPRFDACGYRTLMALTLAEEYYDTSGIFSEIMGGKFQYPVRVIYGDPDQILIPEVLQPKTGSNISLRGSSVMLISLLEAGGVDYAFEYESVIHQHQLNMIELPDLINMGELELQEIYANTSVLLDFQRFKSVTPEFLGDTIEYGITIPSNGENPELAAQFIKFLFSDEGRKIMDDHAHSLYEIPVVDHLENLPDTLTDCGIVSIDE